MNIIGQIRLKTVLDTYTLQTLPKTLMFLGETGCGKHTFARYLAEKFEFRLIQIDEKITQDDLENFLLSTIDTLYVIDLNKFTEKQQNQFLKFIEEPTKSAYILLLANSEAGVLHTVLNRCTKLAFEPYSLLEIEQITHNKINEQAFKIFKTPGKLVNVSEKSFSNILTLANAILTQTKTLPYTYTIANIIKVNYKDLYDKVDFYLLFDAIEYLALEDFKNRNLLESLIIFNITNKFKQFINHQSLIKETLMINYLTTLWEALHNDTT